MKIYVNKTPKKKEECLFYRKTKFNSPIINDEYYNLNGKSCSFKNESIFGAECRCLEVGLSR